MTEDDSEVIHGSSSAISVPAATFAAIFLSQTAFSMKYTAVESSEIYQTIHFWRSNGDWLYDDIVGHSELAVFQALGALLQSPLGLYLLYRAVQ